MGAAAAEVRPLAAARGDLEEAVEAAAEQRPGEKEEQEVVDNKKTGLHRHHHHHCRPASSPAPFVGASIRWRACS